MKHKPCPFCGSDNLVITIGCMYVECIDCGTFGPSATADVYSCMQREIQESIVWDKWDERYDTSKVENT